MSVLDVVAHTTKEALGRAVWEDKEVHEDPGLEETVFKDSLLGVELAEVVVEDVFEGVAGETGLAYSVTCCQMHCMESLVGIEERSHDAHSLGAKRFTRTSMQAAMRVFCAIFSGIGHY